MSKCLVTKLNGNVDNNELLRIGEIRIKVSKAKNPTQWSQGLRLYITKPVKLEIVGEGYFTDNTLTGNKGKSITITDTSSENNFCVSKDDIEVAILDKYSITGFNDYGNYSQSRFSEVTKTFDLESFKFSPITYIDCINSIVTGDIANLKNCVGLRTLYLSNTGVTGDIANLKNCVGLTTLALSNTGVTGDIANLKNCVGLTTLYLSNTGVTGDIANLKNCVGLIDCTLGESTGDIAVLPETLERFVPSTLSTFTWTYRKPTAKILCIYNAPKIDNVDKMLQDQASCVDSVRPYNKIISATGTRTSASDEAVATLQSKGYTISIVKA